MALSEEVLPNSEIARRIKEAMEPQRDQVGNIVEYVYPVPGRPQSDRTKASSRS